jgi:hypothetical protein
VAASGGRPGPRRCFRPPCSSARCQRRSVCGLTEMQDHRSGGSSRLAAASKARSAVVYCGRFPPRLRIASWWRRTTTSSSRSPPPRASKRTTPHSSRYSKQASTTHSLNQSGLHHQHASRWNRVSLPHSQNSGRSSLNLSICGRNRINAPHTVTRPSGTSPSRRSVTNPGPQPISSNRAPASAPGDAASPLPCSRSQPPEHRVARARPARRRNRRDDRSSTPPPRQRYSGGTQAFPMADPVAAPLNPSDSATTPAASDGSAAAGRPRRFA